MKPDYAMAAMLGVVLSFVAVVVVGFIVMMVVSPPGDLPRVGFFYGVLVGVVVMVLGVWGLGIL